VKVLRAVVVMGVAGAGKTVVGRGLARRLGWRFIDGDDHHPALNRAKMSAGIPLSDEDRWPWLDRLRALLDEGVAAGTGTVLACSALKASYRARLGTDEPHVGVVFLDGDPTVIEARLQARRGHYMPASLLGSQLAALEPPSDAVRVDVGADLETIVATALAGLTRLDEARSEPAPIAPTPEEDA
jgi:gluconokinase